jgi:hypothetical protein
VILRGLALSVKSTTRLRALHSKKDGALIFPSDIDAEVEAIQDRVKLALNEHADKVKEEIRAKHSEITNKLFS